MSGRRGVQAPMRGAIALLGLLSAASCSSPRPVEDSLWQPVQSKVVSTEETPRITHGATSRERLITLAADLEAILRSVLPQVTGLLADLDALTARWEPPLLVGTSDASLRAWGAGARAAWRGNVDYAYDEAARRLDAMRTVGLQAARERALQLAAAPAPLDAGITGDPVLDDTLETFTEVLDGALGLDQLAMARAQQLEARTELFEAYSSFSAAGAEEAMQGRISLHVGGESQATRPRVLLAFRDDSDGPGPAAHRVVQATRHRIMRGPAVVTTGAWQLAATGAGDPGVLPTEVHERWLVASDIAPRLLRDSPQFDQLRDMRIELDVQSAVFDADDRLVGGVDWRLEYSISVRGDVTWALSRRAPVHDAGCAEVMRLLGRG